MRVFVAIQISDEMRKALITAMHELKKAGLKGSYTPAQNLHMTLCFIGEVDNVQPICRALEQIRFSPFRLTLSDLGNFKNLLWIGAKGGQKLAALVKELRKTLIDAGISFDDKDFVPHITLIRKMIGNPPAFSVQKADMMVSKISLMRSEQKEGKAVYTEIAFFGKK